jgi:hypothetical protein
VLGDGLLSDHLTARPATTGLFHAQCSLQSRRLPLSHKHAPAPRVPAIPWFLSPVRNGRVFSCGRGARERPDRDELRAFSASQRAYPNTSQGALLRRQKPRAQSLRAVEDAPATLQGRELQRMPRRFENWKQCVAWATPLRGAHWALTAPNDRLASSLKIHVLEASDKARTIVCATARVDAREPIDEPASPRIFLEIDISERDESAHRPHVFRRRPRYHHSCRLSK